MTRLELATHFILPPLFFTIGGAGAAHLMRKRYEQLVAAANKQVVVALRLSAFKRVKANHKGVVTVPKPHPASGRYRCRWEGE